MRKIVFLLFGLFALSTVKAQDRAIFTCISPEGCIAAVNDLLWDSTRVYVFSDSYFQNDRYIVEFIEADPSGDTPAKVGVIFQKRIKDANPDLEIEGTIIYELTVMRGKYLDLFPIWQKYADPDADVVKLAKRGTSGYPPKDFPNPDGSGQGFSMRQDDRSPGIWVLNRNCWTKKIKL